MLRGVLCLHRGRVCRDLLRSDRPAPPSEAVPWVFCTLSRQLWLDQRSRSPKSIWPSLNLAREACPKHQTWPRRLRVNSAMSSHTGHGVAGLPAQAFATTIFAWLAVVPQGFQPRRRKPQLFVLTCGLWDVPACRFAALEIVTLAMTCQTASPSLPHFLWCQVIPPCGTRRRFVLCQCHVMSCDVM